MKVLDSVLDAIGNTPIVRLNRLPGLKVPKCWSNLNTLTPAEA